MRLALLLSLLCALPLLGCPAEEEVVDPDMIWAPALDEADSGTLDFGDVEVGTLAEESITLTNNTDSAMVFSLDVDLDAFVVSFPNGDITLGRARTTPSARA